MAQGDTITSGNFTFTDTSIEGVKIVEVKTYGDSRGYFMAVSYTHLAISRGTSAFLDRSAYSMLQRNCRSYVMENCSREKFMSDLVNLYLSLIHI